jgi:hypothetical protein
LSTICRHPDEMTARAGRIEVALLAVALVVGIQILALAGGSAADDMSGGGTMLLAFGFLARRRRDGDLLPAAELFASDPAGLAGLSAGAQLVAAPAVVEDREATIPRWRRPSLLEARKADPLRSVSTEAERLSFRDGGADPADGHERRFIRYRLVRLLDSPDELLGGAIGFLDEGDEVQPLRRSGGYWEVLCPDGRRGWVHRMTLGEAVGAGVPARVGAAPGHTPDEDVVSGWLVAAADRS